MATILLSAAGAAIGSSIGGTVAGLATATVGRAIGATLGRIIDERILGDGAEPVEQGKVDRFRLSNTGEGAPIAQVYGRMRLGGHVIWASDFQEVASVSGGGKGKPSTPKTTRYSYSVSLAVAVCEGQIAGINRVWADGEEVAIRDLNMRVYSGDPSQLPDPLIEAIEGQGQTPAYRGTAYVVMEDLALEPFGNRVPQFSFEVVRQVQPGADDFREDAFQNVSAVALMPGTGEYALSPVPVYYTSGPKGQDWAANINSPAGKSDFSTSMDMLQDELPSNGAVSLIVSWFGNDLRCGNCVIKPKVERREFDGRDMPWRVSGVRRAQADEIVREKDRPIYGGTPADASVVAAIRDLRARGQRVMFYPFILMDQMAGNGLPNPWAENGNQPPLPWRGRITLSKAPGQVGSPDGTDGAAAQVAAFFGSAKASDFRIANGEVTYSGPADWGMRRFILHYAALCAAAGE